MEFQTGQERRIQQRLHQPSAGSQKLDREHRTYFEIHICLGKHENKIVVFFFPQRSFHEVFGGPEKGLFTYLQQAYLHSSSSVFNSSLQSLRFMILCGSFCRSKSTSSGSGSASKAAPMLHKRCSSLSPYRVAACSKGSGCSSVQAASS